MKTPDIVYMTVDDLRRANAAAIANDYGRSLTDDFINDLPKGVKLPVSHAFAFDDMLRVRFVWNGDGDVEFIDVDYKTFESFPRFTAAGMFTKGEPVH